MNLIPVIFQNQAVEIFSSLLSNAGTFHNPRGTEIILYICMLLFVATLQKSTENAFKSLYEYKEKIITFFVG